MKQKTLFKLSDYKSDFGGALFPGKRKSRRPLSSNNPLHLVLRADTSQSGSILKHRTIIDHYSSIFAAKFCVKIYEKSLVSNHIHLVAIFASRDDYKKFIRAVAGVLSRKLKIKWHLRPWSRLLHWGRDLHTAIRYTLQNHLEATHAIPYQNRTNKKNLTARAAWSSLPQ